MISRKIVIISLAIAGFTAPGLSSASWFHDPEAGVPGVDAISELKQGASPTREQIVAGIASFDKNPVSADGLYRYAGGDASWDFIGPVYERRNGQFVRTDRLMNSRQSADAHKPYTRAEMQQMHTYRMSND